MKEEIDLWGRTKTKGMIKNILQETSYYNDTVMVLANALHFKFESSYEIVDLSKTQPLLHYCGSFDGSEVLRMPYKQGCRTNKATLQKVKTLEASPCTSLFHLKQKIILMEKKTF